MRPVNRLVVRAGLCGSALLVLWAAPLRAADTPASQPGQKAIGVAVRAAEKLGSNRRAVLIGINNYADPRIPDLKFAESDARALRDALVDPAVGGFAAADVRLLLGQDASALHIRKALYDLRTAGKDDLVVIYFSGHGAKQGGESFWVTQDAVLAELGPTALPNAELARLLEAIPSERIVTLLDCCYAADTVLNQKALVNVDDVAKSFTGKGRVTIAGAGGGEEAVEAEGLKQGVFTHFVVAGLRGAADDNHDGVVTLIELWRYLEPRVLDAARQQRGVQKPTMHMLEGQQTDRFLLTLNPAAASLVVTRLATLRTLAIDGQLPVELFKEAERLLATAPTSEIDRKRREVFERLADGKTDAETAKLALAALKPTSASTLGPSAPLPPDPVQPSAGPAQTPGIPPASAPAPPSHGVPQAESNTELLDCGNGVRMQIRLIPAGTFMMGSADGASGEEPVHSVTISQSFYLGVYEVTQTEWLAVTQTDPSLFHDDRRPIANVSWLECRDFLAKLCAKNPDWDVEFPTEAQWEYACRSGAQTQYCFGDSEGGLGEYAWFVGNSGDAPQPVGSRKASTWGLYDMHGNVWEWCEDWYSAYRAGEARDPVASRAGADRVLRGGSWDATAIRCRASTRLPDRPDNRAPNYGLRVAAKRKPAIRR